MLRTSFALVLLSTTVLGAGSAAAQASASASPRATAGHVAQTSGIPAGTYNTTLTAADVHGRMKSVPVDSMTGAWTLAIDATGHFTVKRNGTSVVEGVAQPKPGHRVFFDATDTGAYACKLPATYRYSVRGDHLTFRKVRDNCRGRVVALTSHPYVRGS